MLLSLIGNTVTLIIFLGHPSKMRLHRTRSQRIVLTSTTRLRPPRANENDDPAVLSNGPDENSSDRPSLILPTHSPITMSQKVYTMPIASPCPTATSPFTYYLASLAVSDLLMALFCIPFTFTQICLGYWPFSAILCPVVVYAQLVMVTASSLSNTAISLNRLCGIVRPFRTSSWHSKNPFKHTSIRLACIWLVALSGSTVQLVVTRVRPDTQANKLAMCNESWADEVHHRAIYSVVLFLTIYLIPLAIQGTTYGFIGHRLLNRTIPGEQIRTVEANRLHEKRRVGCAQLNALEIVDEICSYIISKLAICKKIETY
ncbi:hypothetical protein P879_01952 [Paragonimus westermani]|uniref:G-protein coupled receptors family 1 profile domain-containing protein n=1 Tax=Paragonimus westermani TaxID=34504 RepID=A0A8T0DW58_9TREM|nr:hypothetical protein P879_01952 [Paragonimus westermani]